MLAKLLETSKISRPANFTIMDKIPITTGANFKTVTHVNKNIKPAAFPGNRL